MIAKTIAHLVDFSEWSQPSCVTQLRQEQKTWCCVTAGMGCTTAPPAANELYDCTAGATSRDIGCDAGRT